MRIAGLVLAGGRSRRFGSEKAMALLDGRPLIAHVAAALQAGCAAVAVNAPPASGAADWARAGGLSLLPDPAGAPDGPLTGVLEGLRWAAAEGFEVLAVAPCDTPRLPADLVARLAEGLRSAPAAPAAFAQTTEGPQPLCALWRASTLGALTAALVGGHPPVRGLLCDWGAAAIDFADASAFANLNTAESLAGRDKARHGETS